MKSSIQRKVLKSVSTFLGILVPFSFLNLDSEKLFCEIYRIEGQIIQLAQKVINDSSIILLLIFSDLLFKFVKN